MSQSQNIYDNVQFFESYRQLRLQEYSYNNLLEQPAIKSLLPDVKGMAVLDLGCGYGINSSDFIRRGAARVVGIDLSAKMLEVARRENAAPNVEYCCLDLNDLHTIHGTFNLVFSSLALHYIEDFPRLLGNIHRLLNDNGLLIFSQEHPLTTAPLAGPQWLNEEPPEQACYRLSDYLRPGERVFTWFIEGVRKYHRSFSEIINALIHGGFIIEQMVEPLPNADAIEKLPAIAKEIHKPSFLVIKALRKTPGRNP